MKLCLVILTAASLFGQSYNLENKSNVGLYTCAAAGASGTTYTCALASAPAAYVTGQAYWFKADVANTGASTINLSSLGAKTIKKLAGSVTTDLAAGDILAGQWTEVVYDGTNMQMQGQLGSYPSVIVNTYTNAGTTGTLTNGLAKINSSGAVIRTATSDLNSAIGVTISGAGTTGNAVVQLSGTAPCVFDNTSVAGDWVQISPSVAGNCHDAGATYPGGGAEVIGVVLDSGAAGNHNVTLLLNTPTIYTTSNVTPVSNVSNNTAEQNMMAVTIPSGYLNQAGKTLHAWTQFGYTTGSAAAGIQTWKAKLCSVSGCGSGTVITLATWATATDAVSITAGKGEIELYASTVSTGATGTMEPHGHLSVVLAATNNTPPVVYFDTGSAVTGTFDLTATYFLQFTVQWATNGSAATAQSIGTERQLFAEVR